VHHAINVAAAGDVIVVAAGGRPEAAMIGELLSSAARLKGIAGVVVDGAVRDTGTLVRWPDFAVFARWITPRGPTSMERGIVNGPIVFGGVPVSPHDLVIGDDDGLVFVPHAVAEAALKPCLARVEAEAGWEAALAGGKSTLEVFGVPAAST
jgi:regulator of RNase E activity RraA